MKRWTAIALLAVALGVTMHFWPASDRQPITPSVSKDATYGDSPVPPPGSPAPAQQPPTTSVPSPERVALSGTAEPPPVTPVRIEIRAPATARPGDTFSVTIDVQALRGIRQLVFSVIYKKSILQLAGSSPGAFAQQGGTSAQFEEVSDGSLLVRVGLESGVIAGAGSVAVLEFQALKRGVSPLSVQGVTYFEDGRQDPSTLPTAHEGSITIE
jgi:cohesin domain-containing protein